jgi:hypothetical protein
MKAHLQSFSLAEMVRRARGLPSSVIPDTDHHLEPAHQHHDDNEPAHTH